MNVVFVASEAVPFAKTGGLADVLGALPSAIACLGHRATLILPAYREVWWRSGQVIEDTGRRVEVSTGRGPLNGRVFESRLPRSDVRVYLIGHPGYFDRDHLYLTADGRDDPENGERFGFFCKAALQIAAELEEPPDIIHAHDWQAGLIPLLMREHSHPRLAQAGSLFTIHNLAYQGIFAPEVLGYLELDARLFTWRCLEYHGRVNFLKAGLVAADLLNTVSPTYAREIQTPEFGCGLEGVLRARRDDLRGVVNGIDLEVWSPSNEAMLAQAFGPMNVGEGKAACKAALQRRASFDERPDVPLLAQIGRLDRQKGWDLLLDVADDLLSNDVQFVVLGEGQPRYHEALERLEDRFPGKFRAFLDFSPTLAHQIEAGADLFLMPSLYEPCGLNQLYSLAHGTVPIVRATGGLADTVVDATPDRLERGEATGVSFREPTPRALLEAIDRGLALYRDPPAWSRLVAAGMRADWSWERSAREYVALYDEVRERAARRAADRPGATPATRPRRSPEGAGLRPDAGEEADEPAVSGR